MDVDEVIARARRAAGEGVTRMCMGAAWRDAPDGPEFETVLRMVRGVAELGLEVCCTLGMLTDEPGAPAEGGRAHRLQPQSRYVAASSTADHHDARLRRAAAHARARCGRPAFRSAAAGSSGMGESERRPLPSAAAAGDSDAAPGERADQPAGARRRAHRWPNEAPRSTRSCSSG